MSDSSYSLPPDQPVIDAFLDMEYGNQQIKQQQQEIKVSLKSLVPGWILSRDVLLKDGVLLLSEGHALEKKNIDDLLNMEKSVNEQMEVHVLKKGK